MPELDKFYRGVRLVWASEEAHPYHVLHWSDDPRSHPWCEACRVRKPPSGSFLGEPDEKPDDVTIELRPHDPVYVQRTLIDAYHSLGWIPPTERDALDLPEYDADVDVPTDPEGAYWYWVGLSHKHHVRTDGTCYTKHFPLCAHCNPNILEGVTKPWDAITAPIAEAPARTTTATPTGPAEVPDVKAGALF